MSSGCMPTKNTPPLNYFDEACWFIDFDNSHTPSHYTLQTVECNHVQIAGMLNLEFCI